MYQNIENEISFSPSSSSTIWTQISGVQLIHKKIMNSQDKSCIIQMSPIQITWKEVLPENQSHPVGGASSGFASN